MTDYLLWEVILNGNSPASRRVIDSVLQPVAPTTAEQRLARKNELKARGTLLIALPDKHQLKFNTHKDAKTLMEAIEKRFGGNTETKKNKTDLEEQSLNDLFNSLKIYEAEVKNSSSASTSTKNIAFVSISNTGSTNEPVSAVASVFVIDADDLEEIDLKWQMAMLIAAMTGVFKQNRSLPTMLSWHSHLQVLLLTIRKSQFNVISYQTGLKSVEARLLVYQQNESVFEEDIKLLKLEVKVQHRDNALVSLRQNLEKAEQERDDLKLKYQSGNGYHAVPPPYIGTFMPPKHDLALSTYHRGLGLYSEDESETKTPHNIPNFVQPTKQVKSPRPSVKHVENSISPANSKTAIPKPTSNGKCRNRKACFMCKSLDHLIIDCDYHEKKMAQPIAQNHAKRGTHKHYSRMPLSNPQRQVVPPAVLTQSKLVPITAVRPVTTAVCKIKVTKPRQAKIVVTNPNSPPRRHISRSPSPKASNFPTKVTVVKAPMVNAAQGKSKAGKLDFDDVYFVKELKFNLFSISLMCDKKNSVLFTDTECLVLSLDFKLPDENQVLLRVPRENNMYNKAGPYFKTINKLVKGNLVRGLPSKVFENDNICVACKKGKQHRASCLENQLSLKVKVIRSDNGTKFKNNDLNQFCGMKGIKIKFSIPRTPQQNGIAERKNRTLIEAARTMLVDSLLPIPFWAEAVNTACFVQNRVLLTKPHNITPYELLHGRTPSISFMRPFGCPVTILNTLDSLGKFDRKVDEGFLVVYSVSSVQDHFDAEKPKEESDQQYVLFPVWSSGSTNPHNTDGDAAFDEKEPEFEGRKPKSEVNVSPSSSAQPKKHDDKTKREAKGKSLVESLIGYRNLSAKFKDFSDNSINEDNAAGTLVPAVGQLSPNSTNTLVLLVPQMLLLTQHMENLHMWILFNSLMILICQNWKALLIMMMKIMLVERLTLTIGNLYNSRAPDYLGFHPIYVTG
nr:ribonuclease H-like domain-containing protein [Tanacetum cinerariifolium]